MLITKTNPVGVDAEIQKLQTVLHRELVKTWGLQSDDSGYKCYGRCYRNADRDRGGYVAENYEGNDEYKEVYWDDTLTALSFFGTSGTTRFDIKAQVNVHLVFFVNLAKLKPSITHRADEEVRRDVVKALEPGLYGHNLVTLDLWIENVLREYPGSRRENRLAHVDMHPIHCFRLNYSAMYSARC